MKAYVYVRVTDKSGNITVVNSDGVVVYTDVETICDTVDFTLLDKADVALDVQLNGNTVAVLYNGTALIDSADYALSGDGTITLKNRYLSTLAAGERRLAALALQCAGRHLVGYSDRIPGKQQRQADLLCEECKNRRDFRGDRGRLQNRQNRPNR